MKWTLIVVGVFVLAAVTFGAWIGYSYLTARVDTVGEVDFDRELAIPPLAESEIDGKGRRVFDLTLQKGHTDLGRDEETATWGVNGSYLGPTLRAKRGEEVLINVTNKVGEDSTLHWHGMHLPAEMDGGPHQMIADEETWSPTWRIDQPAATLWYHPHPHEETAQQVYWGVAGMFILEDKEEAKLPLPRKYGVDDIPVIVQDKEFDGIELDTTPGLFENNGILGDTIVVNGTPGPYFDVTTERVRLRLLNASNARVYNFHFSDDREYDVIASDGGLLPAPVRLDHLLLSPASGPRSWSPSSPARRRSCAATSRTPATGSAAPTTGSTSCSSAPPTPWLRHRTCRPGSPSYRTSTRTTWSRPASSTCGAPPSTGRRWTWTGSTRPSSWTPPSDGGSSTPTAARTTSMSTTCSS